MISINSLVLYLYEGSLNYEDTKLPYKANKCKILAKGLEFHLDFLPKPQANSFLQTLALNKVCLSYEKRLLIARCSSGSTFEGFLPLERLFF